MGELIPVYVCTPGDFSLPDHLRWPIASFAPAAPGFAAYFKSVDDPVLADYLFFPCYLTPLIQQIGIAGTSALLRCILADFRANERRYLFFNYEDLSEPLGLDSVIFQISLNRQRHDRHAIAYPYPVNDPLVNDDPALEEICYHTTFVGYPGSHPVRERIADLLSRVKTLQMYVETVPLFHGHQGEQERDERQQHYMKIMRQSLTVLCPRGAGENSVRFFETLAMGRIPVLVSDHAVLPLESLIPYDEFVIRVPENDVDRIADHILAWLAARSTGEVHAACLMARQAWHSWLRTEQLPALVAYELSRLTPPRRCP